MLHYVPLLYHQKIGRAPNGYVFINWPLSLKPPNELHLLFVEEVEDRENSDVLVISRVG